LDAADPNKDKKHQDKDEQMDVEEKDKINEQGDEVTSPSTPKSRILGDILPDISNTTHISYFVALPFSDPCRCRSPARV